MFSAPEEIIQRLLAVANAVLLAAMTFLGADLWGNAQEQALVWAEKNPHSPRAQAYAAAAERARVPHHLIDVSEPDETWSLTIFQRRAREVSGTGSSSKAAIMIYLPGGPSHMDMYDLKPDAPAEVQPRRREEERHDADHQNHGGSRGRREPPSRHRALPSSGWSSRTTRRWSGG